MNIEKKKYKGECFAENKNDKIIHATKNSFIEEMEEISKDRGDAYGPINDHFNKVAKVWSIYLGHEIKAHDVPMMMVLLKSMRISETPNHHDSHIDIANFVKIADELNNG